MKDIDLGIDLGIDIPPLESEMALEEWDLGPLLTRMSADRSSLTEREWEAIAAVLHAQNEGRSWKPAHRTPVPAWRLSQRRRLWAYRFHKLRTNNKGSKKDAYETIAAEDRITVRLLLSHFAELKKAEPEAWEQEKKRVKEDIMRERRRLKAREPSGWEREMRRQIAREYEMRRVIEREYEMRRVIEHKYEMCRVIEREYEMRCRINEGPFGPDTFLSHIREKIEIEAARLIQSKEPQASRAPGNDNASAAGGGSEENSGT